MALIGKLSKAHRELTVENSVDDFINGASGLRKAEDFVINNSDRPYAFLALAEIIKFYNKAFLIIQGIKVPVDYFNSFIDVVTEKFGGKIDNNNDEETWTYHRALFKCIKLGQEKKDGTVEDLISTGMAYFLTAKDIKYFKKRNEYYNKAIEFFEKAYRKSDSKLEISEILYYIAQVFKEEGNKGKYIDYLDESRKMGFIPSERRLREFYTKNHIPFSEIHVKIPLGIEKVDKFHYVISLRVTESLFSGGNNILEKQRNKIAKLFFKLGF